jgi:hypothetical protein
MIKKIFLASLIVVSLAFCSLHISLASDATTTSASSSTAISDQISSTTIAYLLEQLNLLSKQLEYLTKKLELKLKCYSGDNLTKKEIELCKKKFGAIKNNPQLPSGGNNNPLSGGNYPSYNYPQLTYPGNGIGNNSNLGGQLPINSTSVGNPSGASTQVNEDFSNYIPLTRKYDNSNLSPSQPPTDIGDDCVKAKKAELGGKPILETYYLKGTGYAPVAAEGGSKDRAGCRIYTLDDFLSGRSKFVTAAIHKAMFKYLPYGTYVRIPELEKAYNHGNVIWFMTNDTGVNLPHVIDIPRTNTKDEFDNAINQRLTVIPVAEGGDSGKTNQ